MKNFLKILAATIFVIAAPLMASAYTPPQTCSGIGFFNALSSGGSLTCSASSSILSLNVGPLYVGGVTATTTITANATSTFASGLNLITGCVTYNGGACIGSGGGGSGTVNTGTQGQNAYYAAGGTTISGTSTLFISSASNVGVGTTTPTGVFSISNSVTTSPATPLLVIASTTAGTATTTLLNLSNVGQLTLSDAGTLASPTITLSGAGAQSGILAPTTNEFEFSASGVNAMDYGVTQAGRWTASQMQFTATNNTVGLVSNTGGYYFRNGNAELSSSASNDIQLGGPDAAAAIAETLSANSVSAGTANTAGQNLTFTGSRGTGSATGGSMLFQLGIASSSNTGTQQNSLFTVLDISPTASGTVGVSTTTPTASLTVQLGSSTLATANAMDIWGIINGVDYLFQRIDEWGHLITSGPAPTVTGGTSSVSGNDRNGTITVVGTALTSVTLTFAHAYAAAPDCTESDNSTALTADISSISASQIVFSFSVGVTSLTIFYQCVQHQ